MECPVGTGGVQLSGQLTLGGFALKGSYTVGYSSNFLTLQAGVGEQFSLGKFGELIGIKSANLFAGAGYWPDLVLDLTLLRARRRRHRDPLRRSQRGALLPAWNTQPVQDLLLAS
jgi:hypothetical protein